MAKMYYEEDANLELLKGQGHCGNGIWEPRACSGPKPEGFRT